MGSLTPGARVTFDTPQEEGKLMCKRFDRIPQEAVDQDHARQALMPHMIRQVINTPELMQELFPEEGITLRRSVTIP